MSWADERIKSVSGAIAVVAVPIVIALIGNWYSTAIKESESQQKFVEIALDILRKEPEQIQSTFERGPPKLSTNILVLSLVMKRRMI